MHLYVVPTEAEREPNVSLIGDVASPPAVASWAPPPLRLHADGIKRRGPSDERQKGALDRRETSTDLS